MALREMSIAEGIEGGASMLVQACSDEELNQVLGFGFFCVDDNRCAAP